MRLYLIDRIFYWYKNACSINFMDISEFNEIKILSQIISRAINRDYNSVLLVNYRNTFILYQIIQYFYCLKKVSKSRQ
jgi:hypothetical protein